MKPSAPETAHRTLVAEGDVGISEFFISARWYPVYRPTEFGQMRTLIVTEGIGKDMDQRALVVRLQTPFADYCADDATARDVILAGLSWPTDTPAGYWQGLAVDWIEQGAAVDAEMTEFLKVIATTAKLPQQLRHKARAIVRRQSEEQAFQS